MNPKVDVENHPGHQLLRQLRKDRSVGEVFLNQLPPAVKAKLKEYPEIPDYSDWEREYIATANDEFGDFLIRQSCLRLCRGGVLSRAILDEIPIGAVPTQVVNAWACMHSNNDARCIGVCSGVVMHLPRILQMLVGLSGCNNVPPLNPKLDCHQWAESILLHAVFVAKYPGEYVDLRECPAWPLEMDDRYLEDSLTVLEFMIAHEYGHHLLGHHNSSNRLTPHEMEFAADRFAANAIKSSFKTANHEGCLIDIMLFFGFWHIVENYCRVGVHHSHPKSLDRFHAITEVFGFAPINFKYMMDNVNIMLANYSYD